MNPNRNKIIEIVIANDGLRKINMNIFDSAVRLYDDKLPLAEVYLKILSNPVPFLVFLLRIFELKKEQEEAALKTDT